VHGLYRSAFKPMALAACPSLRAVPRLPNTLCQHVLRMWRRASTGVGGGAGVRGSGGSHRACAPAALPSRPV